MGDGRISATSGARTTADTLAAVIATTQPIIFDYLRKLLAEIF